MPMPVRPETTAASVIFLGHFNPLIFSPDWFVRKAILAEGEVDEAVKNETIEIIHREIVKFDVPSFSITVERNRFQAATFLETSVVVYDLVTGTFRELPETPVWALGINREAHFPLGSEEKWHALGDLLAPKDNWDILFQDAGAVRTGGLRTLIMERSQRMDGRSGHVQVKVEPSRRISNAVFMHVNDHYELAPRDQPIPAEEALNTLKETFDNSIQYSNSLMENIAGLGNA